MRRAALAASSKQTVSVTINSELYAQAKKLGINTSRVAEEALAAEVARLRAEQIRAEIADDVAAMTAYADKHGSFAEMARDHYASQDDED